MSDMNMPEPFTRAELVLLTCGIVEVLAQKKYTAPFLEAYRLYSDVSNEQLETLRAKLLLLLSAT